MIHVFAGPTIAAQDVRELCPAANVHPPVKLGDLAGLVAAPGDVVVLIDGLFHQSPPVRHKEILYAMSNGLWVVGASSMGALRAAELWQYGMIGIGEVFESYRSGGIDSDDAVAVVHASDETYRQFTVALVNIEHALRECERTSAISRRHAEEISRTATALNYSERSWRAIADHLPAGSDAKQAISTIAGLYSRNRGREYDIKYKDAVAALAFAKNLDGAIPKRQTWSSAPWQTFHLVRVLSRFKTVGGTDVPRSAVINYRQLYDRRFCQEWRRVSLAWISGLKSLSGVDDMMLEKLADEAARQRGIELSNLSESQLQYWLTSHEMSGSLSDRELIIRLTVRSCLLTPNVLVWNEGDGPISTVFTGGGWASLAKTAMERTRDLVELSGKSVHDIKRDVVVQHLSDTWVSADRSLKSLNAAARDRGFESADSAVEVARHFCLGLVD
jgi:hypothetical protein